MEEIVKIQASVARAFIEKWHYSHRYPSGQCIAFGWECEGSGQEENLFGKGLYAVAVYGTGVNPYQARFLSEKLGEEVKGDQLLELRRLCRAEPRVEGLPLTKFLARCHKLLKAEGYRWIVSFSDPAEGHDGGIYKAANFQHLGKTNRENHAMTEDGVIRHRRYYYRYARRKGISMVQAREELGVKLVATEAKDRWILKIH